MSCQSQLNWLSSSDPRGEGMEVRKGNFTWFRPATLIPFNFCRLLSGSELTVNILCIWWPSEIRMVAQKGNCHVALSSNIKGKNQTLPSLILCVPTSVEHAGPLDNIGMHVTYVTVKLMPHSWALLLYSVSSEWIIQVGMSNSQQFCQKVSVTCQMWFYSLLHISMIL